MGGDSAWTTSSPELDSDKKLSTAIDVRFFGEDFREGERRGVERREGGATLADLDLVVPVLVVPPLLNAAMRAVASSSELMFGHLKVVVPRADCGCSKLQWLYSPILYSNTMR